MSCYLSRHFKEWTSMSACMYANTHTACGQNHHQQQQQQQ